nr:hypothetical protein [Tanacetum cinerariifolium]
MEPTEFEIQEMVKDKQEKDKIGSKPDKNEKRVEARKSQKQLLLVRTFDPSIRLDATYPPIILPDKEVKAHVELSGGVRRATRASFCASHCVSEDASLPAQEAVLALDTQPLDTDAGADEITSSGSESHPYTKDDWDDIHGVNLGLRKKELYKDPKVCRTTLDRFPTPAETQRSMLNACYDHFLRNVERLLKQNERDTLAMEKAKIEEELVGTKSQLEHRERQAEEIQRAVGFIPDAKEKFDRVVAAFPNTTFHFLDKSISAAASLRANTHV